MQALCKILDNFDKLALISQSLIRYFMKTQLLEDSFDRIAPQATEFSAHFYETLFRHNPELEVLFKNTDQKSQEKKLVFSLAAIVENLRSPEVLSPALQSLGAMHFEVGTLEEHYPLVGRALLESFATYLGEHWTKDVAAAWTDAYNEIALLMLEGAKSPEEYLNGELTFYEWIDLYGEHMPRLQKAIAQLTDYQYRFQKQAS